MNTPDGSDADQAVAWPAPEPLGLDDDWLAAANAADEAVWARDEAFRARMEQEWAELEAADERVLRADEEVWRAEDEANKAFSARLAQAKTQRDVLLELERDAAEGGSADLALAARRARLYEAEPSAANLSPEDRDLLEADLAEWREWLAATEGLFRPDEPDYDLQMAWYAKQREKANQFETWLAPTPRTAVTARSSPPRPRPRARPRQVRLSGSRRRRRTGTRGPPGRRSSDDSDEPAVACRRPALPGLLAWTRGARR